jgi:prepilin-type N-terminal cleavage/methylation domain-containing protein
MVDVIRSRRLSPALARSRSGFTLTEVLFAVALLGLGAGGILNAYVMSTQHTEWSAYSLAAQSLASQALEQVKEAKWDEAAWPRVDELPPGEFSSVEPLDIPTRGAPVWATNFVTITQVSDQPPLREIAVQCVWSFAGEGRFTNGLVTLRAADQ